MQIRTRADRFEGKDCSTVLSGLIFTAIVVVSCVNNVEEEGRKTKIIDEHEDLFKNNYTIKGLTIDIQLKKKRKTHTTKWTAGPHSLSKNCSRRTGNINWEKTPRKERIKQPKTALYHLQLSLSKKTS